MQLSLGHHPRWVDAAVCGGNLITLSVMPVNAVVDQAGLDGVVLWSVSLRNWGEKTSVRVSPGEVNAAATRDCLNCCPQVFISSHLMPGNSRYRLTLQLLIYVFFQNVEPLHHPYSRTRLTCNSIMRRLWEVSGSRIRNWKPWAVPATPDFPLLPFLPLGCL